MSQVGPGEASGARVYTGTPALSATRGPPGPPGPLCHRQLHDLGGKGANEIPLISPATSGGERRVKTPLAATPNTATLFDSTWT